MPDYSESKIYKIECQKTGKCYIGSTTMYVKTRLQHHQCHYKRYLNEEPGYFKCSSYEILKGGDYIIVTIDIYPCENNEELRKREQEHIDANDCVNQQKAFVERDEQKARHNERSKNWYTNNREKMKSYDRTRRAYLNSWGGRTDNVNNSLLKIDPTLFS